MKDFKQTLVKLLLTGNYTLHVKDGAGVTYEVKELIKSEINYWPHYTVTDEKDINDYPANERYSLNDLAISPTDFKRYSNSYTHYIYDEEQIKEINAAILEYTIEDELKRIKKMGKLYCGYHSGYVPVVWVLRDLDASDDHNGAVLVTYDTKWPSPKERPHKLQGIRLMSNLSDENCQVMSTTAEGWRYRPANAEEMKIFNED